MKNSTQECLCIVFLICSSLLSQTQADCQAHSFPLWEDWFNFDCFISIQLAPLIKKELFIFLSQNHQFSTNTYLCFSQSYQFAFAIISFISFTLCFDLQEPFSFCLIIILLFLDSHYLLLSIWAVLHSILPLLKGNCWCFKALWSYQ